MKMKVAIVYDRVNKWGGAERVLLSLHKIYPKAPLYTSVYDSKSSPWARVFPKVYTSFLQTIPWTRKNHEYLAPLMPIAFLGFDFSGYDLVISVTSEFAKNINVGQKSLHICYCLTPTRYLWSGYKEYFNNPFYAFFTFPIVWALRIMDKRSAKKPDVIVGISSEVKRRIKKYYGRDSQIVFPPVNVKKVGAGRKRVSEHYLLVSRLDYGYKKVDLAIKAFSDLNRKLVIVGTGREMGKLKKLANKNIVFAGRVSDKKLAEYYKKAKALIMPQEEDFGIVSIEAQGYGIPVIAFKKGGSLDTVIDGITGVYFDMQNKASLTKAILRFEKMQFKVDNLVTNARKFSAENFKRKFVKIVQHGSKN
jgi:glycosyltransferase involved in cell wall biosynthesis